MLKACIVFPKWNSIYKIIYKRCVKPFLMCKIGYYIIYLFQQPDTKIKWMHSKKLFFSWLGLILKYIFPLYCLPTYSQWSRFNLVIPCPGLDVSSGYFGLEKPRVTWADERRQLRQRFPSCHRVATRILANVGYADTQLECLSGLSPCTGPGGSWGPRSDTL